MSCLLTLTHNGRCASIIPVLIQDVDNRVHDIPMEVKNDGTTEMKVNITPNKEASVVASLSKEDQSFVLIGGAKRTVTIHVDTRYTTLMKLKRNDKLEINVNFENPPSAATIPIFLERRGLGRAYTHLDTPAFPKKDPLSRCYFKFT